MIFGKTVRKAKEFHTAFGLESLGNQINIFLDSNDSIVNHTNIQIFALSPTSCIIMYDDFVEDKTT